MLWLMCMVSFSFLLKVCNVSECIVFLIRLWILNLSLFSFSLFVLIFEKFKILLMIVSSDFLDFWIMFRYFCWVELRDELSKSLVILIIVFIGVWILWFMLVRKLFLVVFVVLVVFFVCWSVLIVCLCFVLLWLILISLIICFWLLCRGIFVYRS